MADAASVGADAGSIRHDASLIARSMFNCLGKALAGRLDSSRSSYRLQRADDQQTVIRRSGGMHRYFENLS